MFPLPKTPVLFWLGMLLLVSSGFSGKCLAQTKEYFPFYSKDTVQLHTLAVQERESMKMAVTEPKGVSSAYRKHFRQLLEESADAAYRKVRYAALLDSVLNPYVQNIFRQVQEGNKQFPASKLILTKSPVENAFALPNGTVVFNVGLLARLENESQIAFVISHELAHVYFQHMQKGIKQHLDAFYDKKLQKEYRQIVRNGYNKMERLEELGTRFAMGSMYHRRNNEKQADSMAYVMLRNTSFDPAQAYTALQLMDTMDEPVDKDPLSLGAFFSCQNFTLNLKAKEKPTSIFDVAPEESEHSKTDTLKTHPDCQKRMGYIAQLAQNYTSSPTFTTHTSEALESIRLKSRREILQSWFDAEMYDYALYEALVQLKESPQSECLQAMVLLCLYKFQHHFQQHEFAKVVSNASPDNPANFNEMLSMLHLLNLSDFKGLSHCFGQKATLQASTHEYALTARYALAMLQNEEAQASALKTTYLQQFKEGRFHSWFSPQQAKK